MTFDDEKSPLTGIEQLERFNRSNENEIGRLLGEKHALEKEIARYVGMIKVREAQIAETTRALAVLKKHA